MAGLLMTQLTPTPGGLLGTLTAPTVRPVMSPLLAAPGTMPTLAPVTASTTPQMAPQPSGFDRVLTAILGARPFGAPRTGLDTFLSPEDEARAKRQALLSIGASLLANSSPSNGHNAPPTLAALGQAIQAGRQSFEDNTARLAGAIQVAKQQQLRNQIASMVTPDMTADQLRTVLPRVASMALAGGDTDLATSAASLMKTLGIGTPVNAQAIQTGDTVTTFVPGLGFYDPTANDGKGGFVPSVTRGLTADQKRENDLNRQLREEQIAAAREAREQSMARGLTSGFLSQTKPIRDRGAIIEQAMRTISDAQNDPALYSSAIANFVQAADQKAQLRYQLLDYFKKNVDPSIGGKWEVLKARILQGKLPQYVSTSMLQHLGNLMQLTRSEYERQRMGEVKRHPVLDAWLPASDEFFTNGVATSAPAGGDPSKLSRFDQ